MPHRQPEATSLIDRLSRRFAESANLRKATAATATVTAAAAIAFVANGGMHQQPNEAALENLVSLQGEDCGAARLVRTSDTGAYVEVPRYCAGEIIELGAFRGPAHITLEGEACKDTRLARDSETQAHLMVPPYCGVSLR